MAAKAPTNTTTTKIGTDAYLVHSKFYREDAMNVPVLARRCWIDAVATNEPRNAF